MHVIVSDKRRAKGEAAGRVSHAWLAKVAEAVMEAEGCPPETELSVAIGDDPWIQELNRKYRSKDVPTDVLAFPQEGGPGGGTLLLGDVAISADTAARQAKEQGHGLKEEMALLLTHGILHLRGWDDQAPAARRRMMRRARELLRSALGGRG